MVDLSVQFAGLKFKNPLVAASGAIGSTPATIRRCIESGAGGVTIKSVGLDEENQRLPRPGNFFLDKLGERGGLMHCYSGLLRPDQACDYVSDARQAAQREDVRLIGSVYFQGPWSGMPPFPPVSPPASETLTRLAVDLQSAGADAIEVCISCGLSMKPSDEVASVEKAIPTVANALGGELRVPFWIKLGFNHDVFWLRGIRTMRNLGMSAMHAYSDHRATFLDIETARPPLSVPFGYGRWLRGLANYATYLSANKTGLHVISSGGIWTWRDAIERMMCGASLASLESAVQYHGYRIFSDMLKGMAGFMQRKGYTGARDVIGAAMPHVYNVREMLTWYNATTVPADTLKTVVDKEKCNGCGKCTSCIYEAIVMEDSLARVDNCACQKCGVCVSICPVDALKIVPS